MSTLEQGKVVELSQKVEGSGVMLGKALVLVNDNPEAVTWVMLQIDKYKVFLPRIKDSRIVKRSGFNTFAVVETDLPWPVKDCWAYLKFTRYDKPKRRYDLKFWMVNGTLKNYMGQAIIEPWDKDARRTLLSYEMLFEPKTAAPDSMISDGVRQAASIMVQRTKLRLMALRKFRKMPKGY